MVKFKNSDEFTALLKKDHDIGFHAGVKAIFYNIYAHYWDLDYAFLEGKLTNLIGEWLENEKLNATNTMPPSAPPSPLTGNAAEIEIVAVEASEQLPVVKVDEGTAAPNPPIASEDPVSELSSRDVPVQPLINLEEEPVATDVKESEAAVDLTAV